MENYTIVTKLGKGACGEVVLVRHKKTNKLAALKTILLDETRKNRTKSAVLREAKILAQLKHPNIVTYHDSFFSEDHLCIVQDYCDGGTLDEKIQDTARKKKYLGEKQVMQWFIQVTMAVQYMHSQRVLHRDLKTQNVFMNKSGTTCRLGDFGISKMMETTIDMASTCVGTPCYLAPEMCQDIPYSSKADVWALGCLLYEMCALRPAFDANNLISLFYKIIKGEVEALPLQYTDTIMSLICLVLNKSPEDRPSARQILAHAYVKEQMSDFIVDLITISELKEKESPATKTKSKLSKSPVKKPSPSSAESSPVIGRRKRYEKIIDKKQLSQTFDSPIVFPLPGMVITPKEEISDTHPKSKEKPKSLVNIPQSSSNSPQHSSSKTAQQSSNKVIEQSSNKLSEPIINNNKNGVESENISSEPVYEDDFEDSISEDDDDEIIVGDNRRILEKRSENRRSLEKEENYSDSEESEYEDDFEEYDSDEDLDGIVTHCKEYHDVDNEYDSDFEDDEIIIDKEPPEFLRNCKNILQEHAIQTLGKTKYSEITRGGKLSRITEEDIQLKVDHKSGSDRLETCFLVKELLSETP